MIIGQGAQKYLDGDFPEKQCNSLDVKLALDFVILSGLRLVWEG